MFHALAAAILGVVEGITEFLPISSTGHLIVAADLLNFNSAARRLKSLFSWARLSLSCGFTGKHFWSKPGSSHVTGVFSISGWQLSWLLFLLPSLACC